MVVVLLSIGGLLAALALTRRSDVFLAFDFAKAAAFKAIVPSHAQPFVNDILTVAKETGISPLIIYGIGDRESNWGLTLSPKGPTGTGDWTARNAATWGSAMPPDGKGWGRGLMQLDYGSHKAWLGANQWWIPIVSIRKGAQELKKRIDFFASTKPFKFSSTSYLTDGKVVNFVPSSVKARFGVSTDWLRDPRPLSGNLLIRAALASYNAGEANVLRAVAAGKDPDVVTTGGNYSKHILERVIPMYSKIAG